MDESSKHIAKLLWGLSTKPPENRLDEFRSWFMKGLNAHVKYFKSNPDTLRRLEAAVRTEGHGSACIYVERMLAGEGRVSLPLIYTRLFRYPLIKAQFDIIQRRVCRAHTRMGMVCVNPYHYNLRAQTKPAIPAVVVKKGQFGEKSRQELSMSDHNVCRNMIETAEVLAEGIPNKYLSRDECENLNERLITVKKSRNEVIPPHYRTGETWCFDNDNDTIVVDETGNDGEPWPSMGLVPVPGLEPWLLTTPGSESDTEAVAYVEPDFWCYVVYHEYTLPVGTTFYSSCQSFVIDGFTSPSTLGRLSLGSIPNPKRSQEVLKTRNQISHGIRITYISGEVYLENLIEKAVFIQSPWMNNVNKWNIATVIKVPGYSMLKIFNVREFASMFAEAVGQSYEAVYALTRMCAIRISFVQGWGSDYKRPSVLSIPCWVEVHLNGPLLWVDRTLACLGSPNVRCTSFT